MLATTITIIIVIIMRSFYFNPLHYELCILYSQATRVLGKMCQKYPIRDGRNLKRFSNLSLNKETTE